MVTPTQRATQRATLPVSSEPPDTTLTPNRAPIVKPTIAPAGTPAPTTPLPLAPQTGGDVPKPAAPASPTPAPAAAPTASQGGERTAPVSTNQAPAAPSPYQTNDPLAFVPLPGAGAQVTETAGSFLPSATATQAFSQTMSQPAGSRTPPGTGAAATPLAMSEQLQQYLSSLYGSSATTSAPTGSMVTENAGSFLPPDLGGEGTPSVAGDPRLPVAAPTTAPLQAPVPTSGGSASYGLTPTTPDGSLLNSTITPGAGVDRYAIANDLLSQWDANEKPQFDRQIQDLSQNAAARGQIGSGMVRGSFRDALNDEQTRRTTAQRGFLTDALGGSIDDAYKNIGIAQQQQGFQAGQAQQGFNNNMSLQQLQDSENGQQWTQLMQSLGFNAQQMQQAWDNAYKTQQLSDDETGQAFQRALQQAIFGAQGNPTDIEEWLAGLYALPQNYTATK